MKYRLYIRNIEKEIVKYFLQISKQYWQNVNTLNVGEIFHDNISSTFQDIEDIVGKIKEDIVNTKMLAKY